MGLRVLVELPTDLPKPEPPADIPEGLVERLGRERVMDLLTPTIPSEIDDARMFAKKLVRLRTAVEFTPNETDGLDANRSWDWGRVEALCEEKLGCEWEVTILQLKTSEEEEPLEEVKKYEEDARKSGRAKDGIIWLSKKASD